jgi:DNA-binding YbaB/EbfC family protein
MFGDIGKMLKLAGEMKTKLPEMQARLAASKYTAQAGGGAAKATVNGKGSLVELWIDPAALADEHMTAGTLADVVKAAVSAAQEQASQAAQQAMQELTGGMNIPGLTGL